MMDIMRAIIEISRGRSESARKSERVGDAWAENKRRAREEGETLTNNLPGWIELRGGKRCIKPGAKATIKRIFQLAASGYGEVRIMRLFAKEGVAPFGTCGRWTKPYLHALLKDRRLLGEFQPTILEGGIATGKPDGPVIANYFPAAISEAEFYAAQRDREKRKTVRRDATPVELQTIGELHKQKLTVAEISRKLGISRQSIYRALVRLGRRKKPAESAPRPVYLFGGGMVTDHGAKHHYNLATWRKGDGYSKALVLDGGRESFPYPIFEQALLHELREIDPREVLEGANGHDEVTSLEGELGANEAELERLDADLAANGVSALLSKRVRQLEARQAELSRQLAAARQKAANPLSAAWGEAKTLLSALDSAADKEDARIRLRAALRRIIAGIRMAVLARTSEKVALVDVEFTGEHAGRFRSLTIWYRRSYGNGTFRQPGAWAVASAAGQGKPIEYLPSDEPGEPGISIASEWVKSLPVEPKTWFPLPE
jgi:DNA invertase Pin-like site-specific DNA recombinase